MSGHKGIKAPLSSFTYLKRAIAHLLASTVMLTEHGSPGELCDAFSASPTKPVTQHCTQHGPIPELGGSHVGVLRVFTHKHWSKKNSKEAAGLVDSVWFGLSHHPLEH